MSQPPDNAAHDEDDSPALISKTQLKREMTALQKLGESLIDLPLKQYKAMPLPDELRSAVDAARGMTKRGALHRQRQFIGRVMRNIDAAPIQAAMDKLQQNDRQAARQFHRVERWRDRLLNVEDADAVTLLCEEFPDVDRQGLGQKVRAARREDTTGKPAGAKRALFRFVAALFERAES